MKRLTFLMLFLAVSLFNLAAAEQEMGVFVNSNTNCIQFIDPETNMATDYYLKGDLGSYGGGLFDVVITHDGKKAVVSNFGDSKIFIIDISAGLNAPPTLIGSVRTLMFAEDMVITPNDQYVLVADGGFSPYVSVVLMDPQLIRRNHLGPNRYANAVDITPDGQTVLVADYFGRRIHAYALDYETGMLTHKKSVRITPFTPVNVTISPDGRTVIAAVAGYPKCAILYFDGSGELHYKGACSLPTYNGQSCVFSKDGTKAYYLSNSQNGRTRVHILNVTGVGLVSHSGTSIKVWPARGTSQLFGVDSMALGPDEMYLYVTNPTISGGIADVAVINLDTNQQVGYIPANGIPTGIAFTEIED